MKTCFVPMCKSGYISQKNIEKVSLFRVPQDKVSEWQRLIPRKDKVLTSNHFIQSVPKKKDESITPLFIGGF
jgi:hypothetical protein